MRQFYVGTSGWQYREFRGEFYPPRLPPRRMLTYYAERLASVEVNSSFYRLPEAAYFARWRDETPNDFRFAIKASRFITHIQRLKDAQANLDTLLARAEALGKKLGPVLFQLPPRWGLNLERLENFLAALPRGHRFAFELRDHSWLVPEVLARLRAYGVAYCIYDFEGFTSPLEVTADFVYVRLHGPREKYRGTYHGLRLRTWSKRIRHWREGGRDVYVYFDNTMEGAAIQNALELDRQQGPEREVQSARTA